MALLDRYGRSHTYVRVSVTDRCNYRCVYCMPAEGLSWLPKAELLSYEEIARIVGVLAGLGVERVRLTGGEPTVRSDLLSLVQSLRRHAGLRDLSLTTNGHTLRSLAAKLREAGLDRVNVSLDSLDPERFRAITRGGSLERVLEGIAAAREAGLWPVKINVVVMRDENDHEVEAIARYFSQWPEAVEVRFIEYMPFESRWHQNVRTQELRERLDAAFGLEPLDHSKAGAGPAVPWRLRSTGLVVGFVSPLSEKFCSTCNRLRLMTDGHLRTCLAHEDTPSLRDLVRQGQSDAELAQAVRRIVSGKPEGHGCGIDDGVPFQGVMTAIGG